MVPQKPVTLEGLAARRAAWAVLGAVLDRNAPLEVALAEGRDFARLPTQDRAFAYALVMMVLRRLGQLDALLGAWMERPLPPKAAPVKHALRLGLAQLLFMNVPPHAAVHTAVEMVRRDGFEHHAGFVNALLQRAVREGAAAVATQDAARINTPAWLWQRWVTAYGEAFARGYGEMRLAEPPLDLSVKADAAAWAERLGGEVVEGSVRLTAGGGVAELPGFSEGAWWVQDVAAAQPVRMLAAAMGGLSGKRVADVCAAPGGKTAQLCAMGAAVTALDRSASRLEVLRENLSRLQLSAEVVEKDALKWQPASPPDAILLDAPCSATGTLRRHPDVAWHRTEADIMRLSQAQQRLLRHAWNLLPVGGFLAYAVCSLEPEEGMRQIEGLQKEAGNVKVLASLQPLETVDSQVAGDGFFVSVIEKG